MSIRGIYRNLKRILSVGMRHRRVCIVDALYPLFLYLLYGTEREAADTLYILGKTIPRLMAEKLGHFLYATDFEPKNEEERRDDVQRLSSRRKLALVNLLLVRGRKVFAQDHLTFSAKTLCCSKYTLLEDAPGSYRACLERLKPICDPEELREDRRYEGYIHRRWMGTNPYCVNRLVSRREDLAIPLVAHLRHEFVDLAARWRGLTKARQNWILDLFGVTPDLIRDLQSCDTVIFTQPIMLDCGIGDAEMRAIFGPSMEKYGETNVLIKVHPRDEFDYAKVFPRTKILRSVAPMQLLNFVSRPFRRAITICSTAVFHLPPETEIVWLGTKVNEKIRRRYGDY